MWFGCSVSGGVNIRKEEKRPCNLPTGTCACEWMLGFHAGMYCLWWMLCRTARINGSFFLLHCTCGISDLEAHPFEFGVFLFCLLLLMLLLYTNFFFADIQQLGRLGDVYLSTTTHGKEKVWSFPKKNSRWVWSKMKPMEANISDKWPVVKNTIFFHRMTSIRQRVELKRI